MKISNGVKQTTLDLLRKIIMSGMDDVDPARIAIYNQKWKIPTDDGLFIVLFFLGSKPIANRVTEVPGISLLTEQYDLLNFERVQIDIASRSMEALQRKEEILMALLSSYSQNLQEGEGFKVNRISAIQDLSALESTAMLNRYSLELSLFAWYSKTKSVDYYEQFDGLVTTEAIPDISFTIPVEIAGKSILSDPDGVQVLSDPDGTPILND